MECGGIDAALPRVAQFRGLASRKRSSYVVIPNPARRRCGMAVRDLLCAPWVRSFLFAVIPRSLPAGGRPRDELACCGRESALPFPNFRARRLYLLGEFRISLFDFRQFTRRRRAARRACLLRQGICFAFPGLALSFLLSFRGATRRGICFAFPKLPCASSIFALRVSNFAFRVSSVYPPHAGRATSFPAAAGNLFSVLSRHSPLVTSHCFPVS
jgi:hypothetical protein